MPEENEYERQRLENIRKNRQLLEELQLDEAASAIRKSAETKKATSSKPTKKRAPAVKKEPDPFTPRRTSSRLRGIEAESQEAKRKNEDETAALEAAERQKRQRMAGDLNMGDIVVNGKEGNFLSDLKGVRYARTFTDKDVEETSDKALKETRKKLMALKLHETFEPNDIKITPERIYWIGFHPVETKPLIFAGDKVGNLGIFDANNPLDNPDYSKDDEEPGYEYIPNISTFKMHSRSISTFVFDDESLFSSSYDGTIRKLDLLAQKSSEVYVVDDINDKDHTAISAVEIAEPNILYFSTLDGRVGRKDIREKDSAADLYQLHEKKIGDQASRGFSLHPRATHLASTASLDRTMKIWDFRKITGKGENAKPMMVAEYESRLSVSSAVWNSHGSIVTTSYDDTVKVYKYPEAHKWEKPKIGDINPISIKHNNQTGRWVSILRARWQDNPSSGPQKFVIGNMNRFVDVYSEEGDVLAQLGDVNLVTAVPASVQLHPTNDWIAGGSASGKIYLWQ